MLHLILADAELELVPEELWNHPAVIKYSQRRNKKSKNLILDSNFHHSAIREIFPGEENRRGRPDIVHYFLLNSLESPLNLTNNLRVYIHTRNNQTIFIKKETKIPKSYNRFIGLMEDLFHNGFVPSKREPLIWIEDMSLNKLINYLGIDDIVVLNDKGNIENMQHFLSKDQILILGGFPSGDFISDVKNYKNVSIFKEPLISWVVAYELISNYEMKFSIL
ncbi:MAG: 16S rRNA methyltransferase [Thermoplasmata archaeon]|nr:16S rRNA methyltransferase [Thermoplasmata archaeon]